MSWIGRKPFYKSVSERGLEGILCAAIDPSPIAWLRLFSASKFVNQSTVFKTLLQCALTELFYEPYCQFAALGLHSWMSSLLEANGFSFYQNVVSLQIELRESPLGTSPAIFVRAMEPIDLPAVLEIDNLAFEGIWQNSLKQIESAFLQCQMTTVLEVNGLVAGYSMSTLNPFQAHLARIAVHPEFQGQHAGTILLHDLFHRCMEQRVGLLSVNTQDTNTKSLRLYESVGFERTGEKFPVFLYSF